MSKLAKCDYCGKTDDAENASLSWAHIEYQVMFPGFGVSADLCSWPCVAGFAQQQASKIEIKVQENRRTRRLGL